MTPACGFFFSRWSLSAQPVSGTYAVELADTYRDPEALSHEVLDLAAGSRRVGPAVIQQKGEDLPAQNGRVAVAPFDVGVLAFALDALEQPIHGCPMQRDRAESSCLCGGHSLLHVPDNLPPDELSSLALVWCHYKWHCHHLSFTLLLAFTSPTDAKSG